MTRPAAGPAGASPERTHALIVGVSRYATGSDWDLRGPVGDALRFRSWLLARGVPEQNITLLLSPLDGADPGVPHRPADHGTVRRALVSELPSRSGSALWVWWGGHGVLDRNEKLRLFCADATTADKRNLNLDAAQRSSASDLLPGFEQQIWVVDACQTFVEDHAFAMDLPDETLPVGRRVPGREQALLLSASRGQRAGNDPGRGTGLFSDALLGVLERAPSLPWLPDPQQLYRDTRHELQRAVSSGPNSQVPSISIHSPTVNDVGSVVRPGVGRPGAVARLVDCVLAYPFAVDPTARQAMVELLPTGVLTTAARHPVPRYDTVVIVRALLRLPDGLRLLYEAVTALDGDEERAADLAAAIRAAQR